MVKETYDQMYSHRMKAMENHSLVNWVRPQVQNLTNNLHLREYEFDPQEKWNLPTIPDLAIETNPRLEDFH